jgi:single-strand DNA-binding protein
MPSLNKVTLIGSLGRDPEVKVMASGGKVVNISVATSDRWTDKKTGEKKEATEWHRIVIWNEHLQKFAEANLKKGSLVYLEGAIKSRKYTDSDGKERVAVEIVLQQFRGELVGLSSRSEHGNAENGGDQDDNQQSGASRPAARTADPDDADIPF